MPVMCRNKIEMLFKISRTMKVSHRQSTDYKQHDKSLSTSIKASMTFDTINGRKKQLRLAILLQTLLCSSWCFDSSVIRTEKMFCAYFKIVYTFARSILLIFTCAHKPSLITSWIESIKKHVSCIRWRQPFNKVIDVKALFKFARHSIIRREKFRLVHGKAWAITPLSKTQLNIAKIGVPSTGRLSILS